MSLNYKLLRKEFKKYDESFRFKTDSVFLRIIVDFDKHYPGIKIIDFSNSNWNLDYNTILKILKIKPNMYTLRFLKDLIRPTTQNAQTVIIKILIADVDLYDGTVSILNELKKQIENCYQSLDDF